MLWGATIVNIENPVFFLFSRLFLYKLLLVSHFSGIYTHYFSEIIKWGKSIIIIIMFLEITAH